MILCAVCQLKWSSNTRHINMQKPNKFNNIDEISKHIKHSFELMTKLSKSFKFSDPTPMPDLLPANHSVSTGILKFEFCESLEEVHYEQKDTAADDAAGLAELLSSLNLCESQLDEVIRTYIDENQISNDGTDKIETDGDKSGGIEGNTESINVTVASNEQISPSQQQRTDIDCREASNDGNNNIETDGRKSEGIDASTETIHLDVGVVGDETSNGNSEMDGVKSGGIDPNTQITHLDIDSYEQTAPIQKQQDNQPLPFLVKHIHSITWPNQDEVCFVPVMQLFGQKFDAVMIYGVVTSLQVENGGLSQRFVIDDGSGSISVVWRANNQLIGKFEAIDLFLTTL